MTKTICLNFSFIICNLWRSKYLPMANPSPYSPTGVVFSSHVSTPSGPLLPRPQATPFVPGLSVCNPNSLGFSPFLGASCPSTPSACFNSPLSTDPAVSNMELPSLQLGVNGVGCPGAPIFTDPLTDPRIRLINKQLAFQTLLNGGGGQLILNRLFVGGLPNNACLCLCILLCAKFLCLIKCLIILNVCVSYHNKFGLVWTTR
jgi:hypothetical protein